MCKPSDTEKTACPSLDLAQHPEAPKVKSRVFTQTLACLAASQATMASGAVNGWTAGTLPSLDKDPDIEMGTWQQAWVVGIIAMGAIVGSTVSGRAIDWLGRRTTMLIISPVALIGWLTVALAPNLAVVLTGRAICGLATAFLFSAPTVYNSEVTEARMRGRLGTLSSLFITFGVVLSYMAGALFSWRISCYICAAPPLTTFGAMLFVPESPYWLLLKSRKNDAIASLKWLRGPNCDLTEEMSEMEAKIVSVGRKMEYRELWRSRTRKPFLLSLFMMTLQQVCGGNILMMYTGTIFISAGVVDYNMATVYTGLVQILGTVLSVLMVDHAGRRPMIVVSTGILGTTTVLLGVYYYLNDVEGVAWPSFVPLTTVLLAVFGYCLGCRTIPWLLSAELFNTTIRSTASTVGLFYNRILNFAVIQIYPYFLEEAGAHMVFFVHGGFSLICCLISLIYLPETKGKSLEQIQEYFENQAIKTSGHKVDEINNMKTECSNDVLKESGKSISKVPVENLTALIVNCAIEEPDKDVSTLSDKDEITNKNITESMK